VEAGATSIALTNINGTPDTWDFVKYCQEAGIKPIAGAEIRNDGKLLYILVAANNRGFAWINEFITKYKLAKEDFPTRSADQAFFTDLWDGYTIYPLGAKDPADLFPNERIGVTPWEVNKLFGVPVAEHPDKFVIRQPVTFKDKKTYNLHRLLRAIDQNTLLSKLQPEDQANPGETFQPQGNLMQAFQQYPGIITNTFRLMDSCSITMDFKVDKNKQCFSASVEDDRIFLAKLSQEGLETRYNNNPAAAKRLKKELGIISDMGFSAYFLLTWDIIRYAQSRKFYYVGRGSGANSIVAYCLRITDVDPLELDLYFERFLNPERTSPPDFDIDFSWLDRDEIIDYVLKRHGSRHTALLGMYSTFQYRASVRELGKVFGLPKSELDQLSENARYFMNPQTEKEKIYRLILQYAKMMIDMPNHLSIHPGGILISEQPITNYTALELPPKGFPTAQIDMFIAENIRLDKLDILSQRGLGHIKETIRLVRENRGIEIDITQVEKFKNDPNVQAQIRKADTIGCFYVESPAMRQLLKKLRCDSYKTLVDASSIIRPGVAESGMMKQYIYRYHHPEDCKPLHPKMEFLKSTYYVMVFQEDVMRVGHEFAGLTLGEADVLRRAMSGKYRSSNAFRLVQEKYFRNCKEYGYPEELTHEVWRQMESFAGYSFCKAHSASFAVESFQDLFLKVYYPLEFMVGVVNNFGGFYPTALYFYQLIKAGATLNLPCVNTSQHYTHIRGTDVWTGLVHIKGLEKDLTERLLTERDRNGPYLHLQDFVERTGAGPEQLNMLISIGAFRFTGKNKKHLLWEANFIQKKAQTQVPSRQSLFAEAPRQFELPALRDNPLDDLYDEQEILGYPLRNPFDMVDADPTRYTPAADIPQFLGQTCTVLAYFIADKVVPTKKSTTMAFGTFIDYRLDWLDTVHFPQVYESQPMQGRGFYLLTGKVVEEFGAFSLEVARLEKVGYKQVKYAGL
jgi:DNA polymerase-3 subunit alpha